MELVLQMARSKKVDELATDPQRNAFREAAAAAAASRKALRWGSVASSSTFLLRAICNTSSMNGVTVRGPYTPCWMPENRNGKCRACSPVGYLAQPGEGVQEAAGKEAYSARPWVYGRRKGKLLLLDVVDGSQHAFTPRGLRCHARPKLLLCFLEVSTPTKPKMIQPQSNIVLWQPYTG